MKKCPRCLALYSHRLLRCPECAKAELAKKQTESVVPPGAWIRVRGERTASGAEHDFTPTVEIDDRLAGAIAQDKTVEVKEEALLRLRAGERPGAGSGAARFGAPMTDDAPTPRRLPKMPKRTEAKTKKVKALPQLSESDEFELAMESFHEWSDGLAQSTGADVHATSSDAFVVQAIGLEAAPISEELVVEDLLQGMELDDESYLASLKTTSQPVQRQVPLEPSDDDLTPLFELPPPVVQRSVDTDQAPSRREPSTPKSAEELRSQLFRARRDQPEDQPRNQRQIDSEPVVKAVDPYSESTGPVDYAADSVSGEFDWSFSDEPMPAGLQKEASALTVAPPSETTGAAAWTGRGTMASLLFTAGVAVAGGASVISVATLCAVAAVAAFLSVGRRARAITVVGVGAVAGVYIAWLHTIGITEITWASTSVPLWHLGTLAVLPAFAAWLILAITEASEDLSD